MKITVNNTENFPGAARRFLDTPGGGGKVVAHCVIKTTGKAHESEKWIFNQQKRQKMMEEFKLYLKLAPGLSLVASSWLSNHGHFIIICDYDYKPSRTELVDAYLAIYGKKLHPNCSAVHQLKKDASNLSKFFQRFCHDTAWKFNRNCGFKRTGHLWSEPYHNTVLKNVKSLMRCWVYVMFNPVKAKMCPTPLDYKFNTLTFSDREFCDQCLHNFYEIYKEFSGHTEKSLEEFKEMILALLTEEVEKWKRLNEVQRNLYRVQHHFWDRARIVDSPAGLEETLGKASRTPRHDTNMDDQLWC